MIPPQELKNKVFTSALRGYEPSEVDEYVDFLVEKYSEVFTQCDEYYKKLKLVANKISEMQSEEEAIHKLSIETQKHCDKRIKEAKEAASEMLKNAEDRAKEILSAAEEKEGVILNSVKQIAQSSLSAVSQKAEEQIEATNAKSEALLLSTKTRCARILSEFRNEIEIQRKNLEKIKSISDDFNMHLFNIYKEHLNNLTNTVPESDFDIEAYTESNLLDSILTEIKNDAADIAKKIDIKDYDFAQELEALKNSSESIERLASAGKRYNSGDMSGAADDEAGEEDGEDGGEPEDSESNLGKTTVFTKVPGNADGDDVKIFAGKTAGKYGEEVDDSGPTTVFSAAKSGSDADGLNYSGGGNGDGDDDDGDSNDEDESTPDYGGDNDNYGADRRNSDVNDAGAALRRGVYNYGGGDGDADADMDIDIDDEEVEEIGKKSIFNSIFGRMKGGKKNKSKASIDASKEEDYYGFEKGKKEKDSDDVMNIFEDLED